MSHNYSEQGTYAEGRKVHGRLGLERVDGARLEPNQRDAATSLHPTRRVPVEVDDLLGLSKVGDAPFRIGSAGVEPRSGSEALAAGYESKGVRSVVGGGAVLTALPYGQAHI